MKKNNIRNISNVPEPENYFKGTPEVKIVIPENVILVSRTDERYPSARQNIHQRFVMAINLEGGGRIILDGINYKFPEKHAALIFPFQYHYFFYNPGLKWLLLTFELKDYKSLELLRGRILKLGESIFKYISLILDIYKGTKYKTAFEAAEIILVSSLILNELMASAGTVSENKSECRFSFTDKVNCFINANLNKPLPLKELAERFSYSPSRFRALYRQAMKISPGHYIKESRILKAKRLLSSSDMSIIQIAETCGYDSIYAFSHAFTNHAGISPRKYRESLF